MGKGADLSKSSVCYLWGQTTAGSGERTHCYPFHLRPLSVAWDDDGLIPQAGLLSSVLQLRWELGDPAASPAPFGSSLAAQTLATRSHPATCATAPRVRVPVLTGFVSVPFNPLVFL